MIDFTKTPQVGPTGDESFDSWAGRQIGKLSSILNDEVLNRMGTRLDRIENRLMAFAIDDESFRRTIARVDCLFNAVFSDAGDNRVNTAHQRITGESRRINEIRDRLAVVVESANDWHQQYGERLARLESQTQFEVSEDDARIRAIERQLIGISTALENYGVPSGTGVNAPEAKGRCSQHGVRWCKTPPCDGPADVMAMEGPSEVLVKAGQRLREWMGVAFSQATTDAAVRVVLGQDEPRLRN